MSDHIEIQRPVRSQRCGVNDVALFYFYFGSFWLVGLKLMWNRDFRCLYFFTYLLSWIRDGDHSYVPRRLKPVL